MAAVIAVDTDGREVRLEVGALEGASIQVNEVLVLSWATVEVPQSLNAPLTEGPPAEEPLLGRSVEDVEGVESVAGPVDANTLVKAIDTELREIGALMGIR